jgi:DNA-binding beta-propeller fold protein YncE
MDQIFLPGGLAVDPSGNWLYVVNSNNDLRFNGGTLLALDLQKRAALSISSTT